MQRLWHVKIFIAIRRSEIELQLNAVSIGFDKKEIIYEHGHKIIPNVNSEFLYC